MGCLNLGSCPNCVNSSNVVGEIQCQLLNERALSTGERCTFECVTLLLSFHKGTLVYIELYSGTFSIPFLCPSYLDALLRLSC